MDGLRTAHDTSAYEVPAVLKGEGRLTAACVAQAREMMDMHGLVLLTGLLSDAEADAGLALIRETIAAPRSQRRKGVIGNVAVARARCSSSIKMPQTAEAAAD